MIGPLISAGASLIGGMFNRNAAEDAAERSNAISEQNALRNIQLQKDFAQQGIRWKVEDAKAAGIHPLYALGAQTTSFSPVSVGTPAGGYDSSMGSGIASAGQDISRAMNATRTAPERADAFTTTVNAMTVQKMGLENELLASKVAQAKASLNPPMPVLPIPESKKLEDRPQLYFGGQKIQTDPTTSNFDDYSKRYGDEGLPQWAIAPAIMYRDYMQTTGGAVDTKSWPERVGSSVGRGLEWLDRNIKVFPERR